jgi:cell division protein ZapA (FtsZ GTPase activity inhibitor)
VLQELEEAQASVTRLTAYQARTVGIDSRLTVALQENDDLRQERDSQAQRAKSAEARIAALKHRTGEQSSLSGYHMVSLTVSHNLDKLQTEVRRLQGDLELRRMQRLESSEYLLQDVRSRLEGHHMVRVMHK